MRSIIPLWLFCGEEAIERPSPVRDDGAFDQVIVAKVAFVLYCRCEKLPQTQRLKATVSYYLTVLQVRIPEQSHDAKGKVLAGLRIQLLMAIGPKSLFPRRL